MRDQVYHNFDLNSAASKSEGNPVNISSDKITSIDYFKERSEISFADHSLSNRLHLFHCLWSEVFSSSLLY